jgi:Domain of unknown function (DUF1877)
MSMIGNYRRIAEATLRHLLAHPEEVSTLLYPEHEAPAEGEDHLDIDKSWHLIHFLLNGQTWEGDWPLVGAVMGGTELSDEDVGYGPVRYLLPGDVAEVSRALSSISSDTLWSRFNADAARTAEIYPEMWQGDSGDREYITDNYDRLRAFFAAAAANDQAMLLYLN